MDLLHQQQYLRSLLSHCAADNLPYVAEVRALIEQHLLTLTQEFSSFVVLPEPFCNQDGTVRQLLQAHGTIRVIGPGSTCDIPVKIWLPETYPVSSPLVIVHPFDDLFVKFCHPYVDKSGVVSVPYLSDWNYPHSDLSTLAHNLSDCWGRGRSLQTSRDALQNLSLAGSTSAPRGLFPPSSSTYDHSLASVRRSSSAAPSTSSSLPKSSPSPSSKPQSSSKRKDGDSEAFQNNAILNLDPSEVFRNNAIRALSKRVEQGLMEYHRRFNSDIKRLKATATQLKKKHGQCVLAEGRHQREREALQNSLQIIRTNIDATSAWLATNKQFHERDIDIDDAFVPCNDISKQILEIKSLDLALDDVLYSLERAVRQDGMSCNEYLKSVRSIAREQFFLRAAAMRIEEKLRYSRIQSMATRHNPNHTG